MTYTKENADSGGESEFTWWKLVGSVRDQYGQRNTVLISRLHPDCSMVVQV